MLDKISEYVGGGSILIVGNGEEVNEVEADVVVRMNFGVQEPCDIWVDNFTYLHMAVNYKVPPNYKYCIRLDRGAQVINNRPAYILPKKHFKQMVEELKIERPTTGMQTLWFFKEYFPNNNKIATGFNGELNRYSRIPIKIPSVHKWVREREIYKDWERDEIFRTV